GWPQRQDQTEGRSGSGRAFYGQPAPQHFGQAARYGQPESGAESRMRIEALERLEDARPQLRWDAGPVVDHPESHFRAALLHADGDGLAPWAMSHSVGEQVDKDLLEPHGVGPQHRGAVGILGRE